MSHRQRSKRASQAPRYGRCVACGRIRPFRRLAQRDFALVCAPRCSSRAHQLYRTTAFPFAPTDPPTPPTEGSTPCP